ncbi:MAG: hypothetical protein IAE80_09570 [Anaerolinea sp.]|nr:hypothetical protein [Anaerolinea sp.]HMN13527.1 hypothetical protein [Bellilinea sp.]
MEYAETLSIDLRELVEQRLGKPLAASAHAGLWRCPVCPPEAHSLLLVSADQFRCLGRYPCDGGVSQWMQSINVSTAETVGLGDAI